MKLINPSYKILTQGPGLQGIYEQIELAGRTCYASSHKIQYQENETCDGQFSTTARDFVDRMIASQHYAMLEHGTVYLKVPINVDVAGDFLDDVSTWTKCKLVKGSPNWWAITTNYRRIVELGCEEHLQYLCEPTEFHEKRVTVKFTTDIGVSREFNRHRVNSIAEQSTRYCNFSKDKFNNEISVVLPEELSDPDLKLWLEDCNEGRLKELAEEFLDDNMNWGVLQNWLFANLACEYAYMNLIRLGWKPQQARRVLPLDLSTELVHTAFISDWEHFFRLRTSIIAETGKPHPDASILADPLYREFISRSYIKPLI